MFAPVVNRLGIYGFIDHAQNRRYMDRVKSLEGWQEWEAGGNKES